MTVNSCKVSLLYIYPRYIFYIKLIQINFFYNKNTHSIPEVTTDCRFNGKGYITTFIFN